MRKKIIIDPVTRINGHARITIFSDREMGVSAYFQAKGMKGFEELCRGQPSEEMPRIISRMSGLCSWAHHIASVKALDALWKTEPTPTADKLRRLTYHISHFGNKLLNFYYLNAPDLFINPDSAARERNLTAITARLGRETSKDAAENLLRAQRILQVLGGRAVHPVSGLPGGVSRGITGEERDWVEGKVKSFTEFAAFTLNLFEEIVLKNRAYVDLLFDEGLYHIKTNYMGTVDEKERLELYDGDLKVVDAHGREILRFRGEDYPQHVEEHEESWSNLGFSHLRKVGWKGLSDADRSWLYRVGSLARLNVAYGLKTPQAQEAYERMLDTLPKPCHHTLAFHWADLIEMLYSAELALELIQDPEITDNNLMNVPENTQGEGVGVIESPSGTLIHHYVTDEKGIVEKADIITGSNHNNAAICVSVKQVADGLIRNNNTKRRDLNKIEMACRAYSPSLPRL
ncbi:MAG: Ni/Fe hydrogenase subunit alpha [Candidatus Altiarchaeota archaeon]|nr:Ni/Fe hydrogenase subunit alpha [Candidatus Altiarchaeota archaeon]